MAVSSREQVQGIAPPSMVDGTCEGSKGSDDLEKVYDGITILETTDSDNVGDNNLVHQEDLAVQREK